MFSSEKIIGCVIGKVALDKGYYNITLKELLKFVGGKLKVLRMFNNSDNAYKFLISQQDKLITVLFKKGYSEVGEINPTKISDWCDNNFLS